jgi:nucleoside-diphosphate-sugar epimerase
MNDKPWVAVTGASGYIALHVIAELRRRGYPVRGSLRDISRTEQVRKALSGQGGDDAPLELVPADLTEDGGWAELTAGCRFVHHVASPIPMRQPKREDDLLRPAREGTLRVLRAAADAGVDRVVVTSSIAAVSQARDEQRPYDEDDWTDLDGDVGAYAKSKTMAEQAAWGFIDDLPADRSMELTTINPSLVLGPLLDADGSASIEVLRRLLARQVPGVPRLGFSFVDVRDVAVAHADAMTAPAAAGRRYICSNEFWWLRDIASYLAGEGYRVPTRRLPDWVLRSVALVDPSVRMVVRQLGRQSAFDTRRIRDELEWRPRPLQETFSDTALSLKQLGVVD